MAEETFTAACLYCGQDPCRGIQPSHEDNSCYDGSDGAHPAWWRGEAQGSNATARVLLSVLQYGKLGTFGSPVVEEAAVSIEQLRQELAELKRYIITRNQQLDSLKQEILKFLEVEDP